MFCIFVPFRLQFLLALNEHKLFFCLFQCFSADFPFILPVTLCIRQFLTLALIIRTENLLHSSGIRSRLIPADHLLCFLQNLLTGIPLFRAFFQFKNIRDPLVDCIRSLFSGCVKPLLLFCFLPSQFFQLSGCLIILFCKLFVLSNRLFALLNEIFQHVQVFHNFISLVTFLCCHHPHRLLMLIPLQDFLLLLQLLLLFQQFLLPLFQTVLKVFQLLLTLPDPLFAFLDFIVPPVFVLQCLIFFLPCGLQLAVHFLQIGIQQSVALGLCQLLFLCQFLQALLSGLPVKLYLTLLLFLCIKPVLYSLHFLLFRKISLGFFRKHILIIACILIPYDLHIGKGTFQHIQTVLNFIHFFHGINHGTQILVRQCLQRIVEDFIDLCGLEFL